MGAPIARLN